MTDRARILLTVSGTIDPDRRGQVARGERPRADYFEMADSWGADLLDHAAARHSTNRLGRLVARVAGANALLAYECFRRRHDYDAIVTDGEQVGLPYAALGRLAGRRRPAHLMIVHVLSVPKKVLLYRALRLGARIDTMFVYCTRQQQFVVERLRYPRDRVVITPFMVDSRFFDPGRVTASLAHRPMICSAGLEFRDYPTLIEAVRGLDVRVVLAAASPWSKRQDSSARTPLPDNVEVRRFALDELRQLYADAALVVVPLYEVDFQAGITTILEAMAMGKAVICTRTPGQTDTILDGVTGRYVPPGDPSSLRQAIVDLLADPDTAARLGSAARAWAEDHADIDVYVQRLGRVVAEVSARRRR
jgi:glycosyltransferase involved in cell wall biosynthesis